MNGARFEYGLEPVRLTRQWALDTLLGELGEQNLRVAACARTLADLQAEITACAEEWSLLTGATQMLALHKLTMHGAYAGQLAARLSDAKVALTEAEALRDSAIEAAMLARRGLDALERHRDKKRAGFVQLRLSSDFKTADEQWNIRPGDCGP